MKKILKIISPLVILISVVLIILFRTIPSGKLWEKYIVLYVPVECEDSVVLNAINESGIKDAVVLSQQFLPLNISENSLEYAMFKTTSDSDDNKYIRDRKSYFFDKYNKYRLYYIPREYEHNVGKCISILKKSNITCGLDSNGKYPVFFPIVVTLFAVVICFFSKNRLLFGLSAIIPVLYVFCNPFFPVALSICLLLICSFFISNIWKRKGAFSYLNGFLFIPVCLISGLLCGFASSLASGFLFISASTGMASVFVLYYTIENYIRNKKSFIPVYIRSAKSVSICSTDSKTVLAIGAFFVMLLLGIFTFTSSDVFESKTPSVLLPSGSAAPSSDLPQLEDYYRWTWNVTTFPYKSLNSTDKTDDDKIVFPKYDLENGKISYTEETISYDSDFQKKVFDNISKLEFNSIEEVIHSEGSSFRGGYNSTSSYHLDLFGIIMIIMCYFILLFIYISIIIRARKGAKK